MESTEERQQAVVGGQERLDRSRDFQEDLRVEKRVLTGDVVLPKRD